MDSNGNWTPSEVGEYNLTASTGECRFKCNTNYEWDSGEKKCNARTTLAECSNKPAKSEWNMVDNRIIQTWNGEAWEPSAKEPVFSEEECSDICCFKCKEHYQWNEEDKTCDPGTNEAECTDLKSNAEWWYGKDNVTQKWDDTKGWLPTSTGTYESDVTEGTNGCFFKCIAHYKWNPATVSCEPEIRYNVPCDIPENAVSNGVPTINQTWNETEQKYLPSNIAAYNETYTFNNECRYKCKDDYFYDGYKCMNPCWGSEDPCKYTPNAIEDTCEATAFNEYTCACKPSSETSLQYFWDDGKCLTANFGRICTGQDKCYNNNANSEQSCSNVGQSFSGQDAQYAQKGVCIPKDFAQKTLGNNQTVVVDRNLNIMWQLAIDSNKRTWDEANSYCENLNYDGLPSWRLPTVKELLSIVDNSKDSNAAYEIFGSLPASPVFWSSKTYGDNGINVSLETGESSRVTKSTTLYVRCVKGTKEGDGNFVQANVGGDTIVTDKTTGLIWYNNDTTVSWQDALSACEDLEYAGFDDWRLPNKNELASLYNFEASTGNSDYPGMSTTKESWSSTTIKKYNTMAWVVNFKTGGNGALKIYQQFSKGTTTDISYMCVRTATCGAGKNWDGEKCVDPCEGSGCGELDNSTGVCRLETLDTTKCECEDEYFWTKDEPNDNYICGAEERTVDCIGLPEHASWNTATQITQTLTDVITYKRDMWGNLTDEIDHIDYKYDPTAQGSYNTAASITECRFKCESGYYWDNSSQCLNPCNPNPCSSLSNSTGACTASNATTYKCACNSGYFWDSSTKKCISPCKPSNPCSGLSNSTGVCTANSTTGYTCGCNSGYFWNGSKCVNPCETCNNDANSYSCTGTSPTAYTCNCKSGYFWDGRKCVNPCETCNNDTNHSSCTGTSPTEYTCTCKDFYIWNSNNKRCEAIFFDSWNYDNFDSKISVNYGSGSSGWTEISAGSGEYYMCSSNKGKDSSTATMTITVNIPKAGAFSFSITGTGENDEATDYDTFKLFVDGMEKLSSKGVNYENEITGWDDWTRKGFPLASGTHTLTFQYKKDGSNSKGSDRFCIDQFAIMTACSSSSTTPCIDSSSGYLWSARQSSSTHDNSYNYCRNYNIPGIGKNQWSLPTISTLRTLIQNCPKSQTGGSCRVTTNNCQQISCHDSNCSGCGSGSSYSKLGDTSHLWSLSAVTDNTSQSWYVNFGEAIVTRSAQTNSKNFRCSIPY